MWAAFVIGLLNAFVRPLLIVLTLPVTVLTLGLFLFVVNALMFQFAGYLLDDFQVQGFWQALLGSILAYHLCLHEVNKKCNSARARGGHDPCPPAVSLLKFAQCRRVRAGLEGSDKLNGHHHFV